MSWENEWYMVKHKCGAVFTLNAKTFDDFVHEIDFKNKIECPNCGKTALRINDIKNLTGLFRKQEALSKTEVTIEKFKEEGVSDILHTILKAINKIK